MADTGWVAVSSASSGGSGFTNWENPTNVYASDNQYASVATGSRGSKRLLCDTCGLYSLLEAGYTILGFEFSVEGYATASGKTLYCIQINDNLQDVGTSLTITLPTSESVTTGGDPTALWPGASLDPNLANIGFYVNTSVTCYIDQIKVRWTYSEGSSVKSVNGLALSSIKSINGLAIASVKKINGL